MPITAYEYVTLTGTIIPDTVDIIFQVEDEYRTVFGQNLNTSPNTPQGKLITAEVIGRTSVAVNNATLANQINPNLAGGIYLGAIGALTNSNQTPTTYSTVTGVLLTGVAGTTIPSGSIAQVTGTNAQFSSIGTVVLDISGNGVGAFQAVLPGEIVANPGTLIIIGAGGVLGWETVTNPNAATLGGLSQSDEAFRTFRRNTLASWGSATIFAISSALYNTPGVRSLQRLENRDIVTVVEQGIALIAKSIWFCVDGGTDLDVATAMLGKASGGCGYNGLVSVEITDPLSGSVSTILFDRPTPVPVLVQVSIRAPASVADPVGVVIAAVLAYANGLLTDEPGFSVGSNVSPFELAGAVNQEAPSIYVQLVQVSYASIVSWQPTELPIDINQIATITASSISVIVLT